jgi:Uma2 family endonuclease
MGSHEISLPETRPETEWVRGRPLQKVSPLRNHARLQLALGAALNTWAHGRGEVGTEWRFRITPPHEITRPLVPDIAFVTNARLHALQGNDLQQPPLAPDVAVEILSPGDERIDVDHKIGVYLRSGTTLVIVVDAAQRIVELHDAHGLQIRREHDLLEHTALPAFIYSIAELFSVLAPPR